MEFEPTAVPGVQPILSGRDMAAKHFRDAKYYP
jgi:hypothetical protein